MAAEQALPDSRNDFYVYVHRRATDGSVFYVGKGRRYRASLATGRNPHWVNTVAKHGFTWEIIKSSLSERQAFAEECRLIKWYGRENLCNLTDGGEGMSGFKMPPDALRRGIAARTGLKRTPEQCARFREARLKCTMPPDHGAKISKALKGRPTSQATKDGYRRWLTPENKEKTVRRMIKARQRQVICLDTGEVFENIKSAVDWLKQSNPRARNDGRIRECCDGKRQTANRLRWAFADA